ncbi:hypothetical protein O181_064329, partial [Austropuccinia psidii MF-1]|nr:hypothetical protein [Austropuccinia psidii MF-1]
MEISIFNHPTLLNPSLARIDLIERISNLAHKPPLTNPHESLINFDVQLMHVGNFKRTKNQHNRNRKHRNFLSNQSDVDLSPENYWRLTFPTIEFGHKFLNLVNQINIEKFGFSSKVKFEQSILKMRDNHQKKFKVPHPSLIQKLKTNQFTSPEDERKLYHELDKDSSPNQFILSSLEFGRLDKPTIFDACFCSEYIQSFVSNPSSVNSRCTISIDETSSQIVIKLPQTHQPHGRSTRINCKTVKRIEANLPSILLWLDCSPLFCEDNALENLFTTNNSQQKSRKSGFDHHQMRILPFVGRLIRITFKRDKDCNTFLHHSTRFKLPRINHIFREVRSEPIYTPDNLAKLESVKESLDLAISFQLDKLLHSTILSPDEILELSKLLKGFDSDTLEGALMNLVNNLTDELEESQYKTRPNFRTQTIASKFSIALQAAQSNKSTLFDRRLQFQDNFKCRTVTLTPTGTIFEGPTVEQSNSILRLYDYSPSFIRVAIREEDFSSHHHDREMNSAQFLQERYLPLFSGGLKIAGRNFEFLGYSSSALKDHQAWFVCPFKHRGVVMTAHRIRHNMGDFSKV